MLQNAGQNLSVPYSRAHAVLMVLCGFGNFKKTKAVISGIECALKCVYLFCDNGVEHTVNKKASNTDTNYEGRNVLLEQVWTLTMFIITYTNLYQNNLIANK